jgi:hypothetical protein
LQPGGLMRRARSAALLLSLLLTLTASASQGIWGDRGIAQRFLVEGGLLYAADGRGVSVYDVSDPSNIRRIDVEFSDEETYDIAFSGGADLVAATRRGVDHFAVGGDGTLTRKSPVAIPAGARRIAANEHFVATATERDLTILGRSAVGFSVVRTQRMAQQILALTFVGSHLYVSVDRQAIFIYTPLSGEHIGSLPMPVHAFAQSGSTLWGGSFNHGLVAIDVSAPDQPRLLGTTGSEEFRLVGVAASGSRIYGFEAPRTIRLFDGSSPAQPQLMATVTDWVEAIAASGTHLFISGTTIDNEGLRYESGVPLRVYNTTSLAAPSLAGEVRDYAGPVSGVWTDGSIAYVIDPPFFRVLDVSTTAAPREIRAIALPAASQQQVRVKGNTAIVYGRELVHLVDLSSPLEPRHAGTWATQGHPPSDAALVGDRTFVEANDHSGLHLVDFTNPAHAQQVGGRIWHYHSVAAGDDAIYALQQSLFLTLGVGGGGQIIDRDLISINGTQIETSPANVARPHHVVVRHAMGLNVYALEDRFAPRQTAFVPITRPGLLGAGDGHVYVTLEGVLHRLDLGQTASPVATAMRVSAPMQISVAGEKVVVADRYSVRVFGPDTAPPVEPPPARVPGRRRAVGH